MFGEERIGRIDSSIAEKCPFDLRLLVHPGESTLYDGFRLFLAELEETH